MLGRQRDQTTSTKQWMRGIYLLHSMATFFHSAYFFHFAIYPLKVRVHALRASCFYHTFSSPGRVDSTERHTTIPRLVPTGARFRNPLILVHGVESTPWCVGGGNHEGGLDPPLYCSIEEGICLPRSMVLDTLGWYPLGRGEKRGGWGCWGSVWLTGVEEPASEGRTAQALGIFVSAFLRDARVIWLSGSVFLGVPSGYGTLGWVSLAPRALYEKIDLLLACRI